MKVIGLFIVIVCLLLAPAFLHAQDNRALVFDGINDWVEIPENSVLDISNNLTVAIWARTENNSTAKVVEKETWNSGWTLGQDKWNGWKASFHSASGGFSLSWGDGIPMANQWYHLAITLDGNSFKLYVDGVLKDEVTTNENIRLNNKPVSIGSDQGGQKFFTGRIDEMSIWKVALSQSQIQQIKDNYIDVQNLPNGLSSNDLVNYHSLDETLCEDKVFDSSTYGINGALRNMDACTDRVASEAFGDDGEAYPIELAHFEAEQANQHSVQLAWTTLSEENNSYFTLERSTNGFNFEEVALIEGAGNSNTELNYLFEDNHLANSIYYYRLRQTDFNGQFTYSAIIQIVLGEEENLMVYPNPAKNSVHIESSMSELQMLKLYAMDGTRINISKLSTRSFNEVSIDISQLKPGVYIIQLASQSCRFVKY